jgi:phenylpropionate dioxygenase-like ring-hydroxylating dioxygenase large terminal subunit
MPFWYPITKSEETLTKKPKTIRFMNEPLVLYFKNKTSLIVHSDVCPHMGCSFSKGGWINNKRNLQCPYHGFEFDEGKFVSIPSSMNNTYIPLKKSRKGMPLSNTIEKNGYWYISPTDDVLSTPYFPPEHNDPTFLSTSGSRKLDCSVDSLVENLLDMLHISYVHSFGNMKIPLARNIEYEEIGEYGGRSSFEYTPNRLTISRLLGNTESVVVENEFHLPTTTITRVHAGPITKVVYTQSMPISENETVFMFPAMVPGTYEVYDFGKFVSNFKVEGKDGKVITITKLDKNSYLPLLYTNTSV